MASYLINCIPGIKGKSYLELGIFDGRNFDATKAGRKTSVDRDHPAMLQMSTDDFFAQLPSDVLYDVVFIDACHEYGHVLRDYNNAVTHLAPGGIIFMHDMVPPSRDFTTQHYCGDVSITCYRRLSRLLPRCVLYHQAAWEHNGGVWISKSRHHQRHPSRWVKTLLNDVCRCIVFGRAKLPAISF